ncbi:MAG: hypothetical protein ABII23_03260 [bacterium]
MKSIKIKKYIWTHLICGAVWFALVVSASALMFEITPLKSTQFADTTLQADDPLINAITVSAVDVSGGPVDTSYSGTADLSIIVTQGMDSIPDTAIFVNPSAIPSTEVPNNQIVIVNGVWTGQILVTKAHYNLKMKVNDFANNINGESNEFNVQKGNFNKIWFKLPGEVYTEGLYPGNDPNYLPDVFVAGQVISQSANTFVIYAIDDSWNNTSVGNGEFRVAAEAGGIPAAIERSIDPFLMDLTGEADISGGQTIRLRTADPEIQFTASMVHSAQTGVSSTFTVIAAAYNKIVIIAPDQGLIPGGKFRGSAWEPKTLDPIIPQEVGEEFRIMIYSTDDYFNPVGQNEPLALLLDIYVDGVLFDTVVPDSSAYPYDITFTDDGGDGTKTILVIDRYTSARNDSVTIQVNPGTVDHFEILGVPENAYAGETFEITIIAYDMNNSVVDDYFGTVDLRLYEPDGDDPDDELDWVSYSGVIQPIQAVFADNGPGTGGVTTQIVEVRYAGRSMGNGDDGLQIRVSAIVGMERVGFSDIFDIIENNDIFQDIVLILPGQDYQPGGDVWKSPPTALPMNAGFSFGTVVYAVDNFGNRINRNVNIHLSVNNNAVANLSGDFALITGKQTHFISINTAGLQTVNAEVVNQADKNDSSDITINHRNYTDDFGKILLLADGETHLPGSAQGKSGNPTDVFAHTPMTFTVLACDQYYNRDYQYPPVGELSNSINLGSSDGAINSLNNLFANGILEISDVALRDVGLTTVTALDNDTARSSTSELQVFPGPNFVITLLGPDQITAGDTFSIQVDVVDDMDNVVDVDYTVTLEAVKASNQTPATVLLSGVTQRSLNHGTRIFDGLSYEHVERIQIKATDNYSREEYSLPIKVMPTGLYYVVDCPDSATTDDLFPMSIALHDITYTTHIITDPMFDHFAIAITVENDDGGDYDTHSVNMNNGMTYFNQKYKMSEADISFCATGVYDIAGWAVYNITGADNMAIYPGEYIKVQILAPGEVHRPGQPSLFPDGKDDTLKKPQAAQVPFEDSVFVYAVDHNWNIVTSINVSDGILARLTASDGSLNNQPTKAFSQGQVEFIGVTVNVPPIVTITAHDTRGDNVILSDSVDINVTGKKWEIIVKPNDPENDPNANRFVTGRDFTIIAYHKIYDPQGNGTVIMTPQAFYLIPLNPGLDPLEPTRLQNLSPIYPPNPNLFTTNPSNQDDPATGEDESDGKTVINNVKYRIAENVIFKAYDDNGWAGYSENFLTGDEIIPFEPQNVYYELSVPDNAVVGPPDTFIMTITPRDIVTHTIPINFISGVDILVDDVSNDGTLWVTHKEITNGAVSFAQAFTRAGIVTFRLRDVNDSTRTDDPYIARDTIERLVAGPLYRYEDNIPDSIEAGVTRDIILSLFDRYDNPIIGMQTVLSLEDDRFNVQLAGLSSTSMQTNQAGSSIVQLTTKGGYNGMLFFNITAGSLVINKTIKLLGPPETNLSIEGLSHQTFKGYSVKQNDPIILSAAYDSELVLDRIMYCIDGGEWQVYQGPFTIAEVGIHEIEYYGVTVGELEHLEETKKSLKIFITQAITSGDGLINYPNPFRAGKEPTSFEFHNLQDSNVTLSVYDPFGQKVYERNFTASEIQRDNNGINKILWDGRNNDGTVIANGGYIAILELKDAGRVLKRKIAVRK